VRSGEKSKGGQPGPNGRLVCRRTTKKRKKNGGEGKEKVGGRSVGWDDR